ncbi:hypothetical protein BVY03_01985 [bacterium K02(2017)]|nr:hypothetical protein BVY03_01985 [bacterium K02(2017)]
MFQLSKNSHLLTVSCDKKLNDIKRQLIDEGLYFGYYPLDKDDFDLNHYLIRRIINLYHFTYGPLSDLVSSLLVRLNNGKSFQLKDAPRSSIGPDFNRMIIGSKERLGKITTATIKVTAIPELVSHALISVPNKEQAKKTITHLIAEFAHPMYFRHFDLSQSDSFLKELKSKFHKTEVLLICFSGLKNLVKGKQDLLSEYCESHHFQLKWINKKFENEIIRDHIHSLESYRSIKDQYRNYIWPAAENTTQTQFEKEFLNFSIKAPSKTPTRKSHA